MANPALGTKRICPVTGRKFYDMNKDPVISPYTGEVVTIAPIPMRGRAEPSRAAAAAAPTEEVDAPEVENAEFVSLEDADAEATGGKKAVAGADVDDVEEDATIEDDEDDTFIEETEDSEDDVTDIIGDGLEKEEES